MKVNEVAKEWNISPRTVHRLIKDEFLPAALEDVAVPITQCYQVHSSLVSVIEEKMKQHTTKSNRKRIELIKGYLTLALLQKLK